MLSMYTVKLLSFLCLVLRLDRIHPVMSIVHSNMTPNVHGRLFNFRTSKRVRRRKLSRKLCLMDPFAFCRQTSHIRHWNILQWKRHNASFSPFVTIQPRYRRHITQRSAKSCLDWNMVGYVRSRARHSSHSGRCVNILLGLYVLPILIARVCLGSALTDSLFLSFGLLDYCVLSDD